MSEKKRSKGSAADGPEGGARKRAPRGWGEGTRSVAPESIPHPPGRPPMTRGSVLPQDGARAIVAPRVTNTPASRSCSSTTPSCAAGIEPKEDSAGEDRKNEEDSGGESA
jgi:hypothetical protein